MFCSRDLSQDEISSSESILYPEVRHMQMADLSQATTPADAYGRAGVSADGQAHVQAEVAPHCLKSQALGRRLHDAPELGLG